MAEDQRREFEAKREWQKQQTAIAAAEKQRQIE